MVIRARIEVFDIAANHQADDGFVSDIARFAFTHGGAVTEHGKPLADRAHFLEEV